MKKLSCSHPLPTILKLWLTPIVFCLFLLMHLSNAAGQTGKAVNRTAENDEKIYITADRLVSDSNTNSFEFIGNVRATQGTSVVTADRLKVFYKKNTDNKSDAMASEQSIEKIIVNGHVIMKFEDRTAIAEQAVYTTEDKILVLSGPDSKITRGNDTISGETITIYRAEGQIKVESGKEKRVEAVFYTGKQGIN